MPACGPRRALDFGPFIFTNTSFSPANPGSRCPCYLISVCIRETDMLSNALALAIIGACLGNSLAFSTGAFHIKTQGVHPRLAQACAFARSSTRRVFPTMQQAASVPAQPTRTRAEILSEVRSVLSPVLELSKADECIKALDR